MGNTVVELDEKRVEQRHKRTIRDLLAGKEVTEEAAQDALAWLRGDATVVRTTNGGVRLRVPIMPAAAFDLRGSGR